MKNFNVGTSVKALSVSVLAGVSGTFAATLTLSDAPLFLASSVQPNIMFLVDDSGSMNWETLNSPGARDNFSFVPENDSTVDVSPTISNYDRNEVLQACAGVNVLYYDPTKVYTPWVGVDASGASYTDQNITTARSNPYYATSGTKNLTAQDNATDKTGFFPWFDHDDDGYLDGYVDMNDDGNADAFVDLNGNGTFDGWVDRDGDGIYDPWTDLDGDGDYDLNEFEFESEYECPDAGTSTTPIFTIPQLTTWYVSTDEFVDLSGISQAQIDAGILPFTVAEQQTNFANWYSYYRKREFVAKRSLSEIIASSTSRMGLKTLHNNNTVNTEVKDVDDLSTPVDTTAQTNKLALMNNMFDIDSSGGTPLRRRLEDVGDYYVSGTGPILAEADGGSCQQNFTILMTDGVWNGSNPSVGNADSDGNTSFDGGLYADRNAGISNTLADVAMYYYETDLRPTFDDKVPTFPGVDENDQQHMVTYTVAFGVTGDLDPTVLPGDVSWTGWPAPVSNQDSTIDDVWHAAYNGRGLFLSAEDPEELIDSLNQAIQDIQGRDASASAVAVNSGSVSSSSMLFQAEFNSQTWAGKINGIKINLDGSADTSNPHLASIVPDHSLRVITTHDGSDGVPFKWNNLNATQQTDMQSEDIVEYIRGDDAKEDSSTGFRERNTLLPGAGSALGDIINSSPAYVGEAEFLYPDNMESASYTAFRLDPDGDGSERIYQGKTFRRDPIIYVGGNDGMLHAFSVFPDTTDPNFGKEVFAYVPSAVMSRLPDLADPNYRHAYTVDGSPYVGDAFFSGKWHTMLVSGLNAGGQGIFALDVSNPGNFSSEINAANNVVKWEFDDTDDADLGFTMGKPVIAKANNGRWVAIFGNGYNNTAADGNVGSGTAVLFVVDIETGNVLKKIDTGVNDLALPNGLSAPSTLDLNGDYIIDYVYAGDLEGNLWKFDLSNSSTANWDVSYSSLTAKLPLFTACKDAPCTTSNRQPITVKPQIGINKGATGHLVYFGTGSYFQQNDNASNGLQSFYAVWDKHSSSFSKFDKSHLLQQEILEEKVISNGSEQRRVTNNSISWYLGSSLPTDANSDGKVDDHLGWYLDLVNTESGNTNGYGERSISDALLRDQAIIFTTIIPDPDPCAYGGSGWFMALDAQRGSQPETAVIDIGGDGDKDNDYVAFDTLASGEQPVASSGTRTSALATQPVCVTTANGTENCLANSSNAQIIEVGVDAGFSLGRWSWQEL